MSKTPKRSAGLLMYREAFDTGEVFLVHPVVLTGRRKTKAPGLYLRANIKLTKSH
jgi:hypothetical protein